MQNRLNMTSKQKELIRSLYDPCNGSNKGYAFSLSPAEVERQFGGPVARLSSNENPFGPSPAALDAMKRALCEVHRYPDREAQSLQQALKSVHGEYSFVIGVGMDGVIETVLRVLLEPGDKVVVIEPTFSFYKIAAEACHGSVCSVPLNHDFSVDSQAVITASKGAKITFLCTPNNPTGTDVPLETIELISQSIDGLLFVDCAYGEFSTDIPYDIVKRHENLIIGRTMSKLYGLAGLRLGYAAVPDWFLPHYQKAETPFAVDVLSLRAAVAALMDQEYKEQVRSHIITWREQIIQKSPLPVTPSCSNFCLIDVSPRTGAEATLFCAERGVLVRSCDSFSGLEPHYIRANIGLNWECERLLEVLHLLADEMK
jgi:histidinol-phosphate aminotransferase